MPSATSRPDPDCQPSSGRTPMAVSTTSPSSRSPPVIVMRGCRPLRPRCRTARRCRPGRTRAGPAPPPPSQPASMTVIRARGAARPAVPGRRRQCAGRLTRDRPAAGSGGRRAPEWRCRTRWSPPTSTAGQDPGGSRPRRAAGRRPRSSQATGRVVSSVSSEEQVLRQRGAVVGQVRLGTDEDDRAVVTLAAQLLTHPGSGQPRANDGDPLHLLTLGSTALAGRRAAARHRRRRVDERRLGR